MVNGLQWRHMRVKECQITGYSPGFFFKSLFTLTTKKISKLCFTGGKRFHDINSFPSSATYMRQRTGSGLVQLMSCRLIWTNAGILLTGPLETNFSEVRIKKQNFSFMKIHLKMSSGNWRPFCPGGYELNPDQSGRFGEHMESVMWSFGVFFVKGLNKRNIGRLVGEFKLL